jgi:hypothetical protein
MNDRGPIMDMQTSADRQPRSVMTLDLVLLIAGFACGLVLRQNSAFGQAKVYILPSGTADFPSSLARFELAWLWAFVVGLSFVAVARRFRYGGALRPAEWLAVALAVVLVDSSFPAFRPERSTSMDEEIVWVDWIGNGAPVAFSLWTRHMADSRDYLAGVSLRMTAAAALIGAAAWVLRSKISRGWANVLVIAIAVLLTLGPIRLVEAMSSEVISSALYNGYRPPPDEVAWTRTGLSLYLDARAWFGYSIRGLCLSSITIATVASLVYRGRRWLWTEWASFALATIMACLWACDEFVARPAFDRPTRVVALGTWVLVLALLGWLVLAAYVAIRGRVRAQEAGPDQRRHAAVAQTSS